MDYKGYKLLDKILLVCRDVPEREESHGRNSGIACYQAYLVDPANNKQRESARYWAKWTEYGPSQKTESGKWEREYEIDHEPVEFEFENKDFTLELLDCAGGSSQGGKLSFWNCLVKKEGKTFKIGINSDMLLDLLKNATFANGVCQSPLIFITQNGKVGMTTEGSETYKQCVSDRELKQKIKADLVSKFSFGDILKTTTINEVYLGKITRYYAFDIGRNADRYTWNYNLRDCTLLKLAKPITYNVFDNLYKETRVSDFTNSYKKSQYDYPDIKKTCPKRVIDGKLDLDISEKDFGKLVMDKLYDFEAFKKYYLDNYRAPDEDTALYYFLASRLFGCGTEPFEIPEALMKKIKDAGIRVMDESEYADI
jgi:hypothetical protein